MKIGNEENPGEMLHRERFLTALRREEADRVPYTELGVDPYLAQKLMGWKEVKDESRDLEKNDYSIEQAKELASVLGMDTVNYVLRAPVYARKMPGKSGRLFYGEGLIRTERDMSMIDLPDPHDPALYEEAERFASQKGPYAACLVTRIGIFPTVLGMGLANFSIALYENRPFIESVLDLYCDWSAVVAERVCSLGFDVFISTDDMAFKTNTFFSPEVFRELVLPRYKRVAEKITIPWVIHSDGNMSPFIDDLLSLGIAGLHPIEKGAMDIRQVKHRYGHRVCLLGNVDLNILGAGTAEEVDEEVRSLIHDVAPGGGYIVTSGNSLAGYLLPENVLALTRAVRKYGRYGQ